MGRTAGDKCLPSGVITAGSRPNDIYLPVSYHSGVAPMSAPAQDSRAVSEMLGVAVLVGMTVLVTAALGAGVLLIAEEDQQETAQISFNYLSNQLAVVYEDDEPRAAGRLFIDGPDSNVSWAELDDQRGPEEMVEGETAIFVGPETAYRANVGENDVIEIVYITEAGERVVLATWNEGQQSDPLDDGPGGPDEPGGPGGAGGPDSP